MTYFRLGTTMTVALLLVGCSSKSDESAGDQPGSTASTTSAAPVTAPPTLGLPQGVDDNSAATAGAGLSPEGKLWVVTYGSSTNPLAVTDVSADDQTVTVGLAIADRPATMDLVPSTSTVTLPSGVDPEKPLTVVLGKLGRVELNRLVPNDIVWLPAQ